MRIGAERVKGYDLAEFSRAFARWLQSSAKFGREFQGAFPEVVTS